MTTGQTISWIFLSTAYASQSEPADFNSISNIADGINHAIPTHKELQTSLSWLTKNGLVIKTGNKYSLTEQGKLDYQESAKNTETVLKIWENAETRQIDTYKAAQRTTKCIIHGANKEDIFFIFA